MLRYLAAASALRLFSINHSTRRVYRAIGNFFGARRRNAGVNPHYVERAKGNLAFVESVFDLRDGLTVMELGTGWVHWEALFLRAFYDVRLILFDVWDNRQFSGFKAYARHFAQYLISDNDYRPESRQQAIRFLESIEKCSNFDEVYVLMGATYFINESGSLFDFKDKSVDLVISSDVLEHVNRNAVPRLAKDLYRIIKDGGASCHQIVQADHLRIYDKSVHPKQYLSYSDFVWRILFSNEVQYINRLQHSDFAREFENAGFDITKSYIYQRCDITNLKISKIFLNYQKEDLEATVTRLAASKS
jgi:cyclopropane fatty-acyl-phospholipid synthase-like methyltransferase